MGGNEKRRMQRGTGVERAASGCVDEASGRRSRAETGREQAPAGTRQAQQRVRESEVVVKCATPQGGPPPRPRDLPAPQSRHIPHEVQRQVLARDGMQCSYRSVDGRRCAARGGLQFHHIHPFARGGEATVDNITLRCGPHNALAAEQDYGRAFMRERVQSGSNRVRDATWGWGACGLGVVLARPRRGMRPGVAWRAVRPWVAPAARRGAMVCAGKADLRRGELCSSVGLCRRSSCGLRSIGRPASERSLPRERSRMAR